MLTASGRAAARAAAREVASAAAREVASAAAREVARAAEGASAAEETTHMEVSDMARKSTLLRRWHELNSHTHPDSDVVESVADGDLANLVGRAASVQMDEGDLEERVAKAHSLMATLLEATYRKLLAPHLSAYAADELDEAALAVRKAEAREEAVAQHVVAGHGGSAELDHALSSYQQAVEAADAAAEAARSAADAEEAAVVTMTQARSELVAKLRAIEEFMK